MSISLPESDKKALLATAREAISARILGRPPRWPTCSPAAQAQYGAFVTLNKAGSLRGCIGRMDATVPLERLVRAMALAAAFEDPRFPPLARDELDAIDVEISVLSPMEICRPEDVIPGVHGVHLSLGWKAGVFLPQVATEQGWDQEQFLYHLCIKAGLPPGSHLDSGATLQRFTALVFGEREPE